MAWHKKINSKHCFKTSSEDHKPRRPPQTATATLSFSEWVVCFFLSISLLLIHCLFSAFVAPTSSPPLFVFPLFMPLASPYLFSFFFPPVLILFPPVFILQLPAPSHSEWTQVGASPSSSLQAPLNSDSMTQSTAMRTEGGEAAGAHSELCHCPPEQTEGEREGGGGETVEETSNQLVREAWQSDSQCTITLAFRCGQSERSFWTQLRLNVSSSSFFSPLSFLCVAPSNGNTLLSCLSAVPCLDFSLQTALHAWAGSGQGTCEAESRDLRPPQSYITWKRKSQNHRY